MGAANSTKFIENIDFVFTTGANKTLNTGISLCALHTSEAASDFLFGFCRTNVSFRLIIGKRNDFKFSES